MIKLIASFVFVSFAKLTWFYFKFGNSQLFDNEYVLFDPYVRFITIQSITGYKGKTHFNNGLHI